MPVHRSVLEDLGEELTGIVSPVSLCMALTVALVRVLNPDGLSGGNGVAIASTYYKEQASCPAACKLALALTECVLSDNTNSMKSCISCGQVLLDCGLNTSVLRRRTTLPAPN